MAKYSIDIPKPCSEDWNQMTPLEKGRYCAVCEKQVLDFSGYTKGDLIKEVSSKGEICGRMPTRFLHPTGDEAIKPLGLKFNGIVAAAVNLLVLTTTASVQGQEKVKVELQVKERKSVSETQQQQQQQKKALGVIRGKVVDEEGFALSGVSVIIKGTQLGVGTDLDGCFELKVPKEYSVIDLIFTTFGMEDYPITITDFEVPLMITMKTNDDIMMTTGLIIVKKKRKWLFF
ncbi:carboxypeptidase-like regulatory domain-containing protein [Myroides sp. mNGS23_01]|nr:carboxypeptidase-like regulatory domain-containing protein [Myroides sp. mNGS23_01]WHT40444.1 carboxypeptidase-like regulatory domain-containing protein [Myroides sp. mNGS23_01]